MIKFILAGLWLCVVTLGSAYGVMTWMAQQAVEVASPAKEGKDLKPEMEQIKTKMISVPIIYNGAVQGYVLAQFIFTIDANLAKSLAVKPDLYFVDEAFRSIYSGEGVDFRVFRKPDVAALGKLIKDNVNKRFDRELVNDVFVQELNFLPKDQFRTSGAPKT